MKGTKLTETEEKQLIKLMSKVKLPTTYSIFEVWCKIFGTACAEIILMRGVNKKREIFLIYRDDKFFKGWHIPGRVHIVDETLEDTLKRTIREELKTKTSKPKFFYWFERPMGKGIGQSPRGHEFSFVFIASPKGHIKETDTAMFFDLGKIPKNILKAQIPIIRALKKDILKDF